MNRFELASIALTAVSFATPSAENTHYTIPEKLPAGFSIELVEEDTSKPLHIEFTDQTGNKHFLDARAHDNSSEFLEPLGRDHGLNDFQIRILQRKADALLSAQPEWEITYPDGKKYLIDIDRDGAEFAVQFDPTYHDYIEAAEVFEKQSPSKKNEFNTRGRRFFMPFRNHADRYWIGEPKDGTRYGTMNDLIKDMDENLKDADPDPIERHIQDSYGLDISIFNPK